MTIQELIDELEDMRDAFGEDAEVRLMMQPNWPLEYSIGGINDSEAIKEARKYDDEEYDEDEDEGPDPDDDSEPIVYLLEGRQLCYGDKYAWND